jgi:hypothetical protein
MPSKKMSMDERHFDKLYREKCTPNAMSFIYCIAGRTFDKNRQNVCPYTSIEGEQRVLM